MARRITAAIKANEASELTRPNSAKGSALKVDYPFNRSLIRHVHIRPEETKAKGGLIPK